LDGKAEFGEAFDEIALSPISKWSRWVRSAGQDRILAEGDRTAWLGMW